MADLGGGDTLSANFVNNTNLCQPAHGPTGSHGTNTAAFFEKKSKRVLETSVNFSVSPHGGPNF